MPVLVQLQLLSNTLAAYVFVVVLGLLWGSFANVCIYRWPPSDEFPTGRSVVAPGSHCFVCKTPIRWYDNVPIFAWLWLRGKCRTCKTAFSARYLIVEAATGALFGVAWWMAMTLQPLRESFSVALGRFAIDAAFCWVMVVVTFIDIDTKLILDRITIPSTVLFYAATFLLPERAWYDGLVGAGIGYGLPWTIGWIYTLVTKREGIGMGDFKLLALVGALLGWKGVIVSLFGGSVVGAVVGIIGIAVARNDGKDRNDKQPPADAKEASTGAGEDDEEEGEGSGLRAELPFGPFLCIGALVYLFGEPWIQLKFSL